MPTITGYQNRIIQYAQEHCIRITKGKAERLAIKLHKRGARMQDEDLERIFMHSDPTPKKAFRNLADAKHPLMANA